MALVTVPDYQDLVRRILWYIDNEYSGFDRYGMGRVAGIDQVDWLAVLDDYQNVNAGTGFKKTFNARPTSQEVFPGQHRVNKTTNGDGRL